MILKPSQSSQVSSDTPLQTESWLALMIGNSRLHWAYFAPDLKAIWHTPHSKTPTIPPQIQSQISASPDLWIASVVPAQSEQWRSAPVPLSTHLITLEQVPLAGMYPTFGIDRALAVWGAVATVGAPVLVIDAGTALTFTGADGDRTLVGGAILPGLRVQFETLGQSTAALPIVQSPETLPPRWGLNTADAIASGILHTLLSGIEDFVQTWWQQFPRSAVMLTGGDNQRLHHALAQRSPEVAAQIICDELLIFWGIREVRQTMRSGGAIDSGS